MLLLLLLPTTCSALFLSGLNLTFLSIAGFQIPAICCPSWKETDNVPKTWEVEASTIYNQGEFSAKHLIVAVW